MGNKDERVVDSRDACECCSCSKYHNPKVLRDVPVVILYMGLKLTQAQFLMSCWGLHPQIAMYDSGLGKTAATPIAGFQAALSKRVIVVL